MVLAIVCVFIRVTLTVILAFTRIILRITTRFLQLSADTVVGLIGVAFCTVLTCTILDIKPFSIVDSCIVVEFPFPVLNVVILKDFSFAVLRRLFKVPV